MVLQVRTSLGRASGLHAVAGIAALLTRASSDARDTPAGRKCFRGPWSGLCPQYR